MSEKLLSDNEVHDRLHAAFDALGTSRAETVRGNTAIEAARQALAMLKFGLLYASTKGEDHVPGVMNQPET